MMLTQQATEDDCDAPVDGTLMQAVPLRLTLVFLGVCVALFMGEAALRVREHLSFWVHAAAADATLKDARLEYRMRPNSSGYDSLGFRNQSVPKHADIVAIGDSQTWGVNVSRDHAWPQVLGRISHRSVYSMALGGYGPVQYWALAQDAQAFSPKVIIVALYFGNDIYDAYRVVYHDALYASLRAPGSAALAEDTISPKVGSYFEEVVAASSPQFDPVTMFFTRHSATARALLYSRKPEDGFAGARAWAIAHPDRGTVYECGQVRTILTTAYRLSALDLDEPRISEGLRITNEMLLRTSNSVARRGRKLLIGLIPTKEMAFSAGAGVEEATKNPTYAKLLHMETLNRLRVMSFCEEHHLACVDLLVPLASAVGRNEQIYPTNTDGHPNAAGYSLIASAFADRLKALGW